jgi:hypothetical protein
MKLAKFFKGIFGFCQAKGCRKRYDYRLYIESEGKKLGSAKLCEDCAIAVLTGKQAAQAGEGEKV